MTEPIVPESSGGEGNTITSPPSKSKQISPAIRWTFTLNNYTDEQISAIVPVIKEKCRLGIFGKEICPTTGTPHLQGYIEFKTKSRPLNLFGIKAMHWEKAKGNRLSNRIYCSKEDNNTWCHGTKPPRVKKPLKTLKEDQLYKWQKDICRELDNEPNDRDILWYWSVEGGVGKTQFCKYLSHTRGAICLHGKGSDQRNGVLNYMENNDMCAPEIILVPIPRSQASQFVSYGALESLKDMYFYSGKYEGGMVNENSPHLIVFANEPPDESQMSPDRWRIVQICPEDKV